MKQYKLLLGTLFLSALIFSENVNADPTGDCTAGTEFCEDNTLNTTNATTTTNANTNVNTNTNTNTNTNANTNVNTNTTTTTGTQTNNNTNTNTNTSNNTNVNTNNTTSANTNNNTSVNTNTNTNNNNNINTSTNTSNVTSDVTSNNTNNNNNVNTNTSTSNNTNNTTSDNTNTNVNQNTSDSTITSDNTNTNVNNNISDNTNRNINESKSEQVITQNINQKAPPASAIAPSIMSYSQDLCTTGVSGAFQGQIFGLSGGRAVRDENCERLKLSKYLYDTGMKVAAVGILCQDTRVFKAMYMAGTPCPYEGKIGEEAAEAWRLNPEDRPDFEEAKSRYIRQCRNIIVDNGSTRAKKTRLACAKEFTNQT